MLKASLLKQLFECTLACPWSTQDPYICGFLCLECFPSPQPGRSNLSSKSQFRGHYLLVACPGSLNLRHSLRDPLPSGLIHLTARNTLWHLPSPRLDQHRPTEVSAAMEMFDVSTVRNGGHQPRGCWNT